MQRLLSGRAALLAIAFVTGAAVMIVEIVGTRMIAPVFGLNLFVWAALLGVTMAALAVGYYAGGVLIDRRPRLDVLGTTLIAAGICLALVPLFRRPVLTGTEGIGPRAGPLLSAIPLFMPTLLLLGMLGPMVVRLRTDDVNVTGHRVGGVYAVSTAGSLVGTFLTAFTLIPHFETNRILLGTACILVLLGIPCLRSRRWMMLALLVPLVALSESRPRLPSGIEVLARSRSMYGFLEVVEDRNRGFRALRADHSIIGARSSEDGTASFAFLHMLESIRHLRPDSRNMLQVGLGIGSLPKALERSGLTIDVVEIDPEVVRLAGEYFDFSANGRVYVEDGRALLGRLPAGSYDIVVHDTFTGGTTPEHLLSLEVITRIHDVLRPRGLLALNFLGYQTGESALASWAVMGTLRQSFAHVRAFRDLAPSDRPDSVANLVFFASDGPLDFTIPKDARFENETCQSILRSFVGWEVLKGPPSDGTIITDDKNPLSRLQIAIAGEHFQLMRELLPSQVWID